MSEADSDDEDPFMMFRKETVILLEEEEEKEVTETKADQVKLAENVPNPFCFIVDELFLRKNIPGLESLMNDSQDIQAFNGDNGRIKR